jgi:hypothetical protein
MKFAALLLISFTACAPTMIAGTKIEDTKENRSVLDVIGAYKLAVEQRDVDGVVKLCSTRYYEDNANADPADDYGYNDLRSKVLPETFKKLSDVRLELEVKTVKVDKKKAYADLRFQFQAKMALPAGDKWHADTELNRIELEEEDGRWMIVKGL